MDVLLRMEPQLARVFGPEAPVISVAQPEPVGPPVLTGVLARPAAADSTVLLRVHAGNGIPLASASVHITRGARSFETRDWVFLAMEGYSHLSPAARQSVERRVWSRRAFVTGSILQNPVPAARDGEATTAC
jgi:hypothetical protein